MIDLSLMISRPTGGASLFAIVIAHLLNMDFPHEPAYFQPPFESPIEHTFAYNALRFLDGGITLTPQFRTCGYRMDFIIHRKGQVFGVECDGAEFHNRRDDDKRDLVILTKHSAMSAIYRIPGSTIHSQIDDCLYILSTWEPWAFSKQAKRGLPVLAHGHTKEQLLTYFQPTHSSFYAQCTHPDSCDVCTNDGPFRSCIIKRNTLKSLTAIHP